ncbi:hypothetical protein [Xenorhabdus sp. IM139775]|uniref:hypothetical protein n=1 Tax=Xenorhabdus sp. IM139775 TaxID=3025876 RepID=UPI002358C2CE|nr:hypothetical protein [Xenorhabdus sp. IM139775]MDC9592799.1 hypothetical protein [Xenorhabdus sp. IM139775]
MKKKWVRITEALSHASEKHPVVYEDEVDIHLNPKIGAGWYFRGQPKSILTPGHTLRVILMLGPTKLSLQVT